VWGCGCLAAVLQMETAMGREGAGIEGIWWSLIMVDMEMEQQNAQRHVTQSWAVGRYRAPNSSFSQPPSTIRNPKSAPHADPPHGRGPTLIAMAQTVNLP
jgi:hypothetical protein